LRAKETIHDIPQVPPFGNLHRYAATITHRVTLLQAGIHSGSEIPQTAGLSLKPGEKLFKS
jgi:hypothetical protein